MSQQLSLSKKDGKFKNNHLSPSINLSEKWINSMLKTVGMYPLTMIRTLIQLGYEPLPPTVGRSFRGYPRLYLPNVLKYGSYIREMDGFLGVYRGFAPYFGYELTKMCAECLLDSCYDDYVSPCMSDSNLEIHYSDEDEEGMNGEKKGSENSNSFLASLDKETLIELQKCKKEIIISLVSTAVAHPLKVIATRTIAEFVGHENIYTNVYNAAKEIWTFEGLDGFFSGLYTALLGCAWFIVGSTVIYLSSLHLLRTQTNVSTKTPVKNFLKFGSAIVASYGCYPFQTVTTAMMINGSRLRIAQSDNGYPFKKSYDCYKYLKHSGRLYRGSSLFFRKQM